MSLYFNLLIATLSIPLMLSFDKKLQFYKQWTYLFPSLFIIATFYIFFDIRFTRLGIWGFNPLYHSHILIFNLPLEEWLFFFIVPYASIFLHESIVLYFPSWQLSYPTSRTITMLLLIFFVLIALNHVEKSYTLYISVLMVVALLISLFDASNVIRSFFITFLIILIPFVAVNGILTGSLIEGEVVWYNNAENLGIRIFTIPIEDIGYGFSLILFNLILKAKLRQAINGRKA
ncbi:MAG TPA: lycopene cyclase domain-containing protein [Prolixibacteraceae bacterium]|nr:lycopene cyclase domain-containing protein [Prolixibacteraceae bacterium]